MTPDLYRYAQLLDNYHLSLEQLANLTEWQIHNLYYYPRDDKGLLKKPFAVKAHTDHAQAVKDATPQTWEEALERLEILRASFRWSDEEFNKAKEKLSTHYGGGIWKS